MLPLKLYSEGWWEESRQAIADYRENQSATLSEMASCNIGFTNLHKLLEVKVNPGVGSMKYSNEVSLHHGEVSWWQSERIW